MKRVFYVALMALSAMLILPGCGKEEPSDGENSGNNGNNSSDYAPASVSGKTFVYNPNGINNADRFTFGGSIMSVTAVSQDVYKVVSSPTPTYTYSKTNSTKASLRVVYTTRFIEPSIDRVLGPTNNNTSFTLTFTSKTGGTYTSTGSHPGSGTFTLN